jgi:CO/xanthine dehydrogenase FAD-binding subunit
MSVIVPSTLTEALDALADAPDAIPISGGTDLMVAINAGRQPVGTMVAVAMVPELQGWHRDGAEVVLGAAMTYRQLADPALASGCPALAQAARTVGSPQIRNAGTIAGNLATASPAGDTLPALVALGASVELASARGRRTMPVADFLVGPKRTAAEPDELIVAVRIPMTDSRQEFLKVGTRNAMVIAVASVAAVADLDVRRVHLTMGSVGPTVVRATEAEDYVSDAIDWDGGGPADPTIAAAFGRLASAAARPIDDHRSTADYRRHCVGVLASRALRRLFAPAADVGVGAAA